MVVYCKKTGILEGSYKCKTFGYMMVYLTSGRGRVPQRAHRVIWETEVGKIPSGYHIDHINGIKDDNRLENLRLATNQENSRNRKVNGMTNICRRGDAYRVQLCIGGRSVTPGTYKTLEEAQYNRDLARANYYGEFNGRKT